MEIFTKQRRARKPALESGDVAQDKAPASGNPGIRQVSQAGDRAQEIAARKARDAAALRAVLTGNSFLLRKR